MTMTKKKTMKSHNIYIDETQWGRVVRASEMKETSAASVIREAVKYYLDSRGY